MALRRRILRAIGAYREPYTPKFRDLNLSPSRAHLAEIEDVQPALSWQNAGITNPQDWQHAARTKLAGLLGYYRPEPHVPQIRYVEEHTLDSGMLRRHFYMQTNTQEDIPISLVWEPGAAQYPVMLCLQGTLAGANRSWGELILPADPVKIAGGADYAIQAAKRGYLAVCIEQSCFGERRETENPPDSNDPTFAAALRSLQLGRTLLGERVTNVSQVIDWLVATDLDSTILPVPIDLTRIHAMGNSLGGATVMFATAVDDRISGVIAASCISTFANMTCRKPAGPDYVIPGILQWLECSDIIALSAPRPFITVTGISDHLFPFRGTEPIIEQARKVYSALSAESRLQSLAADGGHRFYSEIAWPAFQTQIAIEG